LKPLLYILIFLTTLTKGQTTFWQRVPDDAKHYYAGFGISWLTGETVKHFTGNKILAGFSGVAAAILAGTVKEKIHDQYLGRGVSSFNDGFLTGFGGTTGAMCLGVKWHYTESRQINESLYDFNVVIDTLKNDQGSGK
jgi:hypothetical protein